MADREDDEASFDALDDGSQATVGPPAVLLFGFDRDEMSAIGELLRELGASDHRVVSCTTTMGSWTVGEALAGDDAGSPLPVGKVPRVVLLSGLTDEQVGGVLDRYRTTGLPRPIFAAATQANLEFTVIQLLEDLIAEHRAMG